MKWHRATETPRPNTEVLAEVKGFNHNRFIVLQWTKEGWWQHIPRMNDIMPSDGWIGTQGLFVIRWAYIAENDLALTWQDVSILITIYEAGIDNGDYRRYNDAEWMKEYSQDILKRFNELKKK